MDVINAYRDVGSGAIIAQVCRHRRGGPEPADVILESFGMQISEG